MAPRNEHSAAAPASAADAAEAHEPVLHALASAAGVQATYQDGTGAWRTAPDAALRAILAALGLPAGDAATARRSLVGLRRAHVRPGLPDVLVAWDGGPATATVRVVPDDADIPIAMRILFEDGGERDWMHDPGRGVAVPLLAEGRACIAHKVRLPGGLPYGHHVVEARLDEDVHRAHLIVAPSEAPRAAAHDWGLFVPTYALHRAGGFGVGDLSDLGQLARWMHARGGRVIATLPLLDTFLSGPIHDPSPYAPVSRRFWNGLLVDPSAEPEYMHPDVQRLREDPAFVQALAPVQQGDWVDHAAVWQLKAQLLGIMAESLEARDSPRRRRFRAYLRRHPDLLRYARFRAATEQHGAWQEWDEEAQGGDLDTLDVDEALVRLHCYIQWIADQQVARVQTLLGDPEGTEDAVHLHLDLPLGAHPSGYDTWNDRAAYALGIETGAPPDGFFEGGQKWGFAPLNPRRLRQSGYRHFAACLRHHLRHATVLRIDHVMGLHRLYWVPQGMPATDGAYVHYPHEEIYAVALLEAHRAGALLVGEDLGTVPASVHEAMDRHHLHRTYVLQLQARAGDGTPPTPSVNSLATLNTHDMVPFAAWWAGDDIEQRRARGYLDDKGATAAKGRRADLRARLSTALGVTTPDDAAAIRDAALRFLFASPAAMVVVTLEDLWLERTPQNQPGFGPDSPEGRHNWSHRTQLALEEILDDPHLLDLLDRLHTRRPARAPGAGADRDGGRAATPAPGAPSASAALTPRSTAFSDATLRGRRHA